MKLVNFYNSVYNGQSSENILTTLSVAPGHMQKYNYDNKQFHLQKGLMMKYKIGKDVYWQRIEGQVYVVKQNRFLLLNKTGSLFWLEIFYNKQKNSICKKLSDMYGVDISIIENDIDELIDELLNLEVLEYA